MASSDAFLSSPLRRSTQCVVPSSSPDLPSIRDLLPQKASRSAIESGGKTAAIPDTSTFAFSSVRDRWRSAQAAAVNQINSSHDSNPFIVAGDNDPEMGSIQPASTSKTPPRRRRRSNEKPEAMCQLGQQETRTEEAMKTTQQAWKKFKSQTPEKDAARKSDKADSVCVNSVSSAADTTLADDTNHTCSPIQDSLLSGQSRARPWNSKDPLQLEPAMVRRKDWTPPKQTAACNDPPQSSAAATDPIELDDDRKTTSFEALLTAYKCSDSAIDESASHQSDGSASKRRRLAGAQPVQTTLAPLIPIASTVAKKKKAPRKKPRTITALATAAYKQANQVDCEDAGAGETNHAPLPAAQQEAAQNKAKEKPRKRPTKSKSRKKIIPPKPILFSPETALKQVAQQDFVFGTSSQLAREQSPTFLRDLQRAMKSSNQLDEVQYTTPLNSDSIEPLECRPKLWDAAARDADGDLFDVAVINLTESKACAPSTAREDPFGYCKADIDLSPRLPRAAKQTTDVVARDDDGFLNLSDILPASSSALLPAPEMLDIDRFPTSPPLPGCQVEPDPSAPLVSNQDLETVVSPPQLNMSISDMSVSAPVATHVTRPAFEDYTDAQLSREVSGYGFKPIKRRSAMLALLEQCWQQKMDHSGPHVRMQSTAATSSKLTASSPAKRPRGRPRKDSGSVQGSQPQDPPPSAQVPETPKRPRGRPRKDAETSPSVAKVTKKKTTSKRKATPKKATPKKATPKKATPKKAAPKKATPKKAKVHAKVVEIADSDSDLTDVLNASPSPSCSTASSRQQSIDLTMSLDEDTKLSLAMTSTYSKSNLFEYIARAITTAPRTTVPSEPSWHEKILLYDPIVLEDLTAWLNSGQLTRVGCDEEIDPAELKKWCESRSICCLWKVNLRGKERKRY
ncbi:hypothetical protein E4U54_007341 [Claviceps lovelessii]|nr:hypothetical protein E4U54_007341 [Claviceps lovelessii]